MNQSALNEQMMSMQYDTTAMADAVRRSEIAYIMKYAMVFIGSLPLLVAYPFVQKHFVKGMMVGSLKG